MNKADLIEQIAKHANLTKTTAALALETCIDSIRSALSSGEDVQLIGFGTFSVSERAERTGRNPRTGEKLVIPSSKVVKFKAGKELKETVNE